MNFYQMSVSGAACKKAACWPIALLTREKPFFISQPCPQNPFHLSSGCALFNFGFQIAYLEVFFTKAPLSTITYFYRKKQVFTECTAANKTVPSESCISQHDALGISCSLQCSIGVKAIA